MFISKCKLKEIEWNILNLNEKIKQLECPHDHQFYQYDPEYREHIKNWIIICGDCGKELKRFTNNLEFLKAKHEIMRNIIEEDNKLIKEIQDGNPT